MSDKLTAKVNAVNNANKYANELYDVLAHIFTPFVEQKILKVDGTLLEKYKKLIPELPSTVPLSVYRLVSDYSLVWVVKTCEPIPSLQYGCVYHETTVYIGDLQGQTLKSICNSPNFRCDFTAEEISEKREVLAKAKKAVSEAQHNLYPFGEYDN